MRRIVVLGLLALVASEAGAQRAGGGRAGFVPGIGRRAFGRVPFRAPGGFAPGFGYGFLPDDSDAGYAYSPQPVVLVPQPAVPPPAPAVQEPPREIHPVVLEYKPQASRGAVAPVGEAQIFGIVLKDGSVRPATTVIAAGDALLYVDPAEKHLRIAMSDVDRDQTLKLNRDRGLNLHLP